MTAMQNAAILFNVEDKPVVLTYQHSSQIPPLSLIYLDDAHSRVDDFFCKKNGRLMPNCALTIDLGQTKKKKIK